MVFDADFVGPDPALPVALLTPEQEATILRLNEEAFSGKNADAYFEARSIYQVAEDLRYDGDIRELFCYHKTEVLRRLHASK